jgi:hypothetical protein
MQGILTFANTVEQFDAGDGDGGVVEVLEAEHGPGSGLDTPMILFDQIVQVFRRSQLGALPCLVFVWNFTHCSMRSGIAIKRDAEGIRADLVKRILRLVGNNEDLATDIPGLAIYRRDNPTGPIFGLYEPSLTLLVQGGKRVMLGQEAFACGASRYLLTSVNVPVIGQV